MANSLRVKLKKLAHDGKINQQQLDDLLKKLDGHDRELQEQIKMATDMAYQKGATDMEKAKQIIIDKLQVQIPKWHLVSEGDLPTDYMDVLLVVDRYSYVIEDWRRDTVQTYWNGDMKAFDYCKGWQAGHEPKIIAWMELPKFEEVE